MASEYFINLTYRCNERCIFCAADIALEGKSRNLGVDEIVAWIGKRPISEGDAVMIAGGEPTLHPHFIGIVSYLTSRGAHVTVFTNGLRLANGSFAEAAARAGVGTFEIALFGKTAERHDAVTQRANSHALTMQALQTLCALKPAHRFRIVLRLLVSRQSAFDNPDIVAMASDALPLLDAVSLNRLILSDAARAADASISWAEARTPINETLRRARGVGLATLVDVPLCVLDDDNLGCVLALQGGSGRRGGSESAGLHYLDTGSQVLRQEGSRSAVRRALPEPCLRCDLQPVCGRVEGWYVRRHGIEGLTSRVFAAQRA